MNTKIVKNVNSQRRLCLTKDFCEYVGIRENSRIVIAKGNNDNELHIISLDKVSDFQEVIAFCKVDSKFRIIVPAEICENDEKFELLVTTEFIIMRQI